MKFREIFRFEFRYQVGRIRTWLCFALLLVVAYLLIRKGFLNDARNGGPPVNSPGIIAFVTGIGNVLWMLVAAGIAGRAAARDVETRMDPLVYTAPLRKAAYLGARWLAALALNALLLLAVPAGMLLAVSVPRVEPGVLGPFRPVAYLSAYLVLALSTATIATAVQFALATLSRRSVTAYLGGVLLIFLSFGAGVMANLLHWWRLGELFEPTHFVVIGLLTKVWTPLERETRLVGLEPVILANALLWVGLAAGVLGFTHLRFRFGHPVPAGARRRSGRPVDASDRRPSAGTDAIPLPVLPRSFGGATRAHQLAAIAWTSFRLVALSGAGLILLAPVAILVAVLMPEFLRLEGISLVPRTAQIVAFLTHSVAGRLEFPWVVIPLLIIYHAGTLVWRERDAGLHELADTTPVPDWVLALGKFLGLTLVLVVWMAVLMAAGVLGQARMGHFDFQPGLYLRTLFGLQLLEYLLFAALAFAIHVVVNRKQIGYLLAVVAYGLIAFGPTLGIEHRLLLYSAAPGWTYTDLRGFGASLGPWLWFKLYWSAWALLLVLAATLLWNRGTERGLGSRLRSARARFTRPVAAVAITAALLLLSVGAFLFYHTNVRQPYLTDAGRRKLRAEYEKRYGQYSGIPQPRLTATPLRIELHPDRRKAEVHGTYRLVNDSTTAIESIHLDVAEPVDTDAVTFDRPVARVREDNELRHRIYTLAQPLRPGETLQLTFDVQAAPPGFAHGGADSAVVGNGTYFTRADWLPAIGYQPDRELDAPGARREFGLTPRPAFRSPDDPAARQIRVGGDPIRFEAVIGTDTDQVAVAPGELRRTWTENGRRYFHYVSETPIDNRYSVFSAAYTLHEESWPGPGQPPTDGSPRPGVAIQIYHHPAHTVSLGRMVASVRAALDLYTRQFGPYPYRYLRLVESPGLRGVQTEAATIRYGEEFSLMNSRGGPQDVDFVFAVVAHAVARGWWGMQVAPADAEGAGILEVGLETYSAFRVVEETLGTAHLERYLRGLRETPRPRAAPPLLRATGKFASSRQAPFALYALHEYVGKGRVDDALRSFFVKYRSGTPPLPTSRDLYVELQAVTPDTWQPLLHDLFAQNTFWELATERATATARPTEAGAWEVTLEVRARKVTIDETGVVTELPMDDWLEVGIYPEGDGTPYLQKHRICTGTQKLTVTVPQKPTRAGLDPRHLLSEMGEDDANLKAVTIVPVP